MCPIPCLSKMYIHVKAKQYRQCTYNVTMRRVSQTIVAVKKQCVTYRFVRACIRVLGRVGVCMRIRACSLAYPAHYAYASYCDVICGPSVSIKFFDIIS